MQILIKNIKNKAELLQVPTMNYGQMQRWQDFEPLHYIIEITKEQFIEKTASFFAEFRDCEIEEDDTDDFPKLIAFKNAGWPDLNELTKKHTTVLEGLIIYNQYEILHLIVEHPETNNCYYYSANSIDEVSFEGEMIKIKGICFQSDYIEHTYNHELPRKYALLKNNDQQGV